MSSSGDLIWGWSQTWKADLELEKLISNLKSWSRTWKADLKLEKLISSWKNLNNPPASLCLWCRSISGSTKCCQIHLRNPEILERAANLLSESLLSYDLSAASNLSQTVSAENLPDTDFQNCFGNKFARHWFPNLFWQQICQTLISKTVLAANLPALKFLVHKWILTRRCYPFVPFAIFDIVV